MFSIFLLQYSSYHIPLPYNIPLPYSIPLPYHLLPVASFVFTSCATGTRDLLETPLRSYWKISRMTLPSFGRSDWEGETICMITCQNCLWKLPIEKIERGHCLNQGAVWTVTTRLYYTPTYAWTFEGFSLLNDRKTIQNWIICVVVWWNSIWWRLSLLLLEENGIEKGRVRETITCQKIDRNSMIEQKIEISESLHHFKMMWIIIITTFIVCSLSFLIQYSLTSSARKNNLWTLPMSVMVIFTQVQVIFYGTAMTILLAYQDWTVVSVIVFGIWHLPLQLLVMVERLNRKRISLPIVSFTRMIRYLLPPSWPPVMKRRKSMICFLMSWKGSP